MLRLQRLWMHTRARDYPGLHVVKSAGSGEGSYALTYAQDDKTTGKQVIGWLVSSEEIAPENFVDNREFISFLHNVVKDNISRDQELVHQALIQKDGWLNIADKRSPTYANRVPDPEDIVGSVRLENGKMLPETYQPMPVHRLVTRNGLFKLSDPLMDALKAASS